MSDRYKLMEKVASSKALEHWYGKWVTAHLKFLIYSLSIPFHIWSASRVQAEIVNQQINYSDVWVFYETIFSLDMWIVNKYKYIRHLSKSHFRATLLILFLWSNEYGVLNGSSFRHQPEGVCSLSFLFSRICCSLSQHCSLTQRDDNFVPPTPLVVSFCVMVGHLHRPGRHVPAAIFFDDNGGIIRIIMILLH